MQYASSSDNSSISHYTITKYFYLSHEMSDFYWLVLYCFCEHSFFFSKFWSFRHDLRPFIHANIPVCPITMDCSKHPERVFQQCPSGGCTFKLLFVRGQILHGKALFAGISGKDHVSISPK